MTPHTGTHVHVFALLCHALLPPSFRREFAQQLLVTFGDRYEAIGRMRAREVVGFWTIEVFGLMRTGLKEYGESLACLLRKKRHHSSYSSSIGTDNMFNSVRQDLLYAMSDVFSSG